MVMKTGGLRVEICYKVESFLFSVDLLGLLNWSAHTETLEMSLEALMNVDAGEIVKFLQDILDALFNILVSNNPFFSALLKLIQC